MPNLASLYTWKSFCVHCLSAEKILHLGTYSIAAHHSCPMPVKVVTQAHLVSIDSALAEVLNVCHWSAPPLQGVK